MTIYCFAWNIWRKKQLHMICGWKGSLVAFSDNCRYSLLTLHQKSTSGGLLNVCFNVESETILMKFSQLHLIIVLVWINLLTLAWLLNIMHWSFVRCWFIELHRSSKYNIWLYIIFKNHTNITANLIIKVFNYWEAIKLMMEIKVFQDFDFHLKAWVLSLATNTVSCFFWSNRLT